MSSDRGDIEAETLLKIVLVLVAAWLALEVLGELLEIVFGPLRPLIGVVVLVLIVLWLLDRL